MYSSAVFTTRADVADVDELLGDPASTTDDNTSLAD